MVEARYYRDYKHNYMILQCGQDGISGSYQYKILTSGKIGEILPCTVRYMNGTTYYYYDISSRATLEGVYRGKKMTRDQVRDVIWQLHGICDKLSGYFMDEAGLVFLPEHIYYDLTNQKYIGLYYPDYRVERGDAYRPLMDFLLEHIDTEDRKLAEEMYRIYEMSEEPYFSIEDALQILEETDKPEEAPKQVPVETEEFNLPENVAVYPAEERQADGKPPKRSFFYPVFAVLSVLGIAGALAVRGIYELTEQEEMALYGAVAALGACTIICLVGCFKGGRKKSGKTNSTNYESIGKQAGESGKVPDIEYFPAMESVSLSNVISKDMGFNVADSGSLPLQSAENKDKPFYAASHAVQESHGCGNTVFFDGSRIGECKLYAVDKKNKKHIELTQFPCTVGKMAGCVDYVLADNSVSRIHARFDRQGDKILLTDMNSTNGTYKNGLRMQPQETVEIEPGDEVRFGSLNYCYR